MQFDINDYWSAICQHGDYYESPITRLFYTIKLIICMLLKSELADYETFDQESDSVHICIVDAGSYPAYEYGQSGAVYWWYALRVGDGILNNWFYVYTSDTSQ